MDIGSGDKCVDAPLLTGILQRLPGAVDVLFAGTAQARNLRSFNALCHQLDCLKITLGSDGKAGFDYVHVQFLQLLGDPQFFFDVHAVARRLLAVPQRCVKNPDYLPIILFLCLSHAIRSFRLLLRGDESVPDIRHIACEQRK